MSVSISAMRHKRVKYYYWLRYVVGMGEVSGSVYPRDVFLSANLLYIRVVLLLYFLLLDNVYLRMIKEHKSVDFY